VKVLFWTCALLLSPFGREISRRKTLALTRSTRSGARNLLVDSAACAVAVRVVGDVGVKMGDAQAAVRSRHAIERCTREAEVVVKVLLWTCLLLLSLFGREKSRRKQTSLAKDHPRRPS